MWFMRISCGAAGTGNEVYSYLIYVFRPWAVSTINFLEFRLVAFQKHNIW